MTITDTAQNPTTSSTASSPTSSTSPSRGGGLLTARLDREWARLRRDPRALRTARSWAAPTPIARRVRPDGPLGTVLATLADLDQLIAATHRDADRHAGCDASGRGDEILIELVALARTEQLAGRIVLQRVLPALLARSRRYADRHLGQTTADTVVAAAWVTLRTYDHERRRRHVAASIVSDAVYRAFRQPLRRRAATEQLHPAEVWARRPADESRSAFEELAGVLAEARRRGVAAHDLDVLRGLVRTGSPTVVASELGVTARTVRNHRDRAIARVRAAVLTDAA